jgi:hypothetical protein
VSFKINACRSPIFFVFDSKKDFVFGNILLGPECKVTEEFLLKLLQNFQAAKYYKINDLLAM